MTNIRNVLLTAAAPALAILLAAPNAHATASFARQTGLPCTTCHTTFPQLTAFGRSFKLHAYTFTTEHEISAKGSKQTPPLNLLMSLPLSLNIRGAYTALNTKRPGTVNSNFEFPQQVNLWLAGRLGDHFGSYTQMTYSAQGSGFNFDNSDFFRYARDAKLGGKSLVWGIDANDDPTFEDLWNSTPAYGFPWAGPDLNVGSNAGALIDNGLGGQVLGLGAYAMWDSHLYGGVWLYRTQHVGAALPANGTHSNIKNVAPYWRFAWQAGTGKNYLEVGTYGLYLENRPANPSDPSAALSGPTDNYTDVAADLTYQRQVGKSDLFEVLSTYIHEKQELNATYQAGGASKLDNDLNTFRLNASYHFGSKYSLLAGPFVTTGTKDRLLYPAGPISGSANGSPQTDGYVAQLAYWPLQNLEFGVQYTGYVDFNGRSTNYDGSGRDASDNNTTFVYTWINF